MKCYNYASGHLGFDVVLVCSRLDLMAVVSLSISPSIYNTIQFPCLQSLDLNMTEGAQRRRRTKRIPPAQISAGCLGNRLVQTELRLG
ncbi:hypothetical protein ACLKA7_011664 [Drosophila subpalustris]